jgi:hypothetical protein
MSRKKALANGFYIREWVLHERMGVALANVGVPVSEWGCHWRTGFLLWEWILDMAKTPTRYSPRHGGDEKIVEGVESPEGVCG